MDEQYHDEFGGNQYSAGMNETAAATPQRPKPDGIMDPAGEAGWFLERERLARGLSLEDVTDATGIHPYHLEAIEYGDMTHMPPRLEALEMIAGYANFLGFDPEPLLQHYVSFLPSPQVAPRRHPANPGPMTSAKILQFGRFPKLPPLNLKNIKLPPMPSLPGGNNGIVAAIAAALILFTGTTWLLSGDPGAPKTEQIAETAIDPIASDPMPTASTGDEAAEVKVTDSQIADALIPEENPTLPPVESETEVDNPDQLGAFIAEQLGVEGDPQTVATTSKPEEQPILEVPSSGGRVYGDEDPKSRVMLKATKTIWLLIEDGQGNRVATQMLNPGDMYRVPNRDGLVAIAQDGGALTYMIDGVEKGVLGKPGSLLAAEPLDLRKLEAKG